MKNIVRIQNKKHRGLAILTTLLIISLLMALLGAFLTVNQAGNRFTMGSLEKRQAQDACMTAFNYAWYELERNRDWGSDVEPLSGIELYPGSSPQVRMELSQVDGEGVILGKYSPNGNFTNPTGTFEMKVKNNLGGRDPLPGVVPSRSVRIEVSANLGGITRSLSALLRPTPISHESLAAGNHINLDSTAELVRIASKDPYINRIRAGGDLNLPGGDNVKFLKHGVAASHEQLNLGGSNLATASDAAVRAAGEAAGGTFATNTAAPHFKLFDNNSVTLPPNNQSLPGGNWVFGDIDHHEYRPAEINYEETHVDSDGKKTTHRGSVERHQRRSSLYNVLTAPNGERWAAGTAIPGSTGTWEPPIPSDPLGSEGAAESFGYDGGDDGFGPGGDSIPSSDVHEIAPGFKANVVTAQFAVRSGSRMSFNGDFIVTGQGDRQPELYFGYDITPGGVAEQESLADGLEAAQNDPPTYMGALVTNGDLNVTGGVLGYGSMISGGELTIKASSGLRTAPELGVVIKGRRIVVNPATEPEPALPGEPVDTDFPVYRDAISADTGGDWTQYNDWLDHDAAQRDTIVDSLKTQSAGASASTLWNTLNGEIGGGGPFPTALLASNGWPSGGNITVEQYTRLKEYYQTVASGYNDGDGDPNWLDFSKRQDDAEGRVTGVLNGIAQWARSYKSSMQDFLTNPDPNLPDMFMEGLVYADEDITINADGKSVKLQGAVIARTGDVTINNPTKVDLIYDRGLLDDLNTGTPSDRKVTLEKVFFTLE